MISLIVPIWNERANIASLVRRTMAALEQSGERFEIIFVDRGSQDGTGDEVRRLQSQGSSRLRLIECAGARQPAAAVLAGWRAARGEVVGCMQAGLQHPPELLPELVRRLRQQPADLVIASRYGAGAAGGVERGIRRGAPRLAIVLAGLILPGVIAGIRDPLAEFFLVRRGALDLPGLQPRGYTILLEVLARSRPLRIAEVPFSLEARVAGASKVGWRLRWRLLRQLMVLAAATGELRHMVDFGLVGLSGTAVNYIGFALLRHVTPSVAMDASASAAVAICNNFLGNEFYTFRDAARQAPELPARLGRFARFFALCLVGLGINTAVVTALSGTLAWPVALAAGIGCAVSWNFLSNSNLTWRRRAVAASARARAA